MVRGSGSAISSGPREECLEIRTETDESTVTGPAARPDLLAKLSVATEPDDRRAVLLLSSLGGILGGLCCLAPIILVLFGLASISAAAGLGNLLYGEYRWAFRLGAIVFLGIGLLAYFRKRGICSLDDAKRERTRILNLLLLSGLTFAGVYIFWTYVVLHYWGIAAGLPWAQYDETWAIPASAVVLTVTALAYYLTRNRS